MRFNRKSLVLAVFCCLGVPALVWMFLFFAGLTPMPGHPLRPPFNLSDRLASLEISRSSDGGKPEVVFDKHGAEEIRMTGDEFLRDIRQRQRNEAAQSTVFRLLDITGWTGLLWVLFGLSGQAVFMGRMIVQWLASERAKSSVVPPAFWWMSLIGASMLMIYFIWRVEVVGLLGQATGWLIYVRNLWFIYGSRPASEAGR